MAIHKEYTLRVKKTIYERIGKTQAIHYKRGETITLCESQFLILQSGKTVSYMVNAGHGLYAEVEYNRDYFDNEVEVLTIETNTSTARLGQRKKS